MKENQQCFFFRFGKNGRTVEEKNKKRCDRNRLAARLDGAGDVTGGAGQSAAGDPRRNEWRKSRRRNSIHQPMAGRHTPTHSHTHTPDQSGLAKEPVSSGTEFYRVLPSFTEFHWALPIFTRFRQVLPSFTEFCRIFLIFSEFGWAQPIFTQFHQVLPSFTEFHQVWLRFHHFDSVSLSFT